MRSDDERQFHRPIEDESRVLVIGSEFAEVAISIDRAGNSPRLRLEDLRTGQVRLLDALELETIVWLDDGAITDLMDPSAVRWSDRS